MNLHPNHLEDLRRSGLTDATIEAAGIRSESDIRVLRSLLNNPKLPARIGSAMVIPFKSDNGTNGYCRIKPDNPRPIHGKKCKYESPKEHPNEIYIPPGTFAALDKPHIDLLITEGEKKALRGDQDGFCTIGLVGVWGWKQGKKARLLPALLRIAWKGRKVFINGKDGLYTLLACSILPGWAKPTTATPEDADDCPFDVDNEPEVTWHADDATGATAVAAIEPFDFIDLMHDDDRREYLGPHRRLPEPRRRNAGRPAA